MKRKTTKLLVENKSPYNSEFVERILASERSIRAGKYTRITLDEIYTEQK